MYEKIQETASWLKERMTTSPKTAIILGTGLGQLASEITDAYSFSYNDIPNFPVSTVEGHAGRLIFGKLGGKDIMAIRITNLSTPLILIPGALIVLHLSQLL